MTGHGPAMDRATSADHRATLSPREAARLIGVGRSSIMRAIEAGRLAAWRDNRNQWQINRADLDHWNADRSEPARTMTADRSGPDHPGHLADTAELAALRVTIEQLQLRLAETTAQFEARLDTAEKDRDRWRAMAEERAQAVEAARAAGETRAQAAEALAAKLTDLLTAREASPSVTPPAPASEPSRRRWWPWRRGSAPP